MANSNNVTTRSAVSRPLTYEELDANFQELIFTIIDHNDHVNSTTAHEAQNITYDNSDSALQGSTVKEALDELGVKNNPNATTDPGPTDDADAGYRPFSRWINTSDGEIFICLDNTIGNAVWQKASLTLDELGSAAIVDMGTGPSQLRTNSQNEALFMDEQEATTIAIDNAVVYSIALG